MSVWDHFEEAQGETWKRSCGGTILRLVTTDLTEVGAEVDRLDLVVHAIITTRSLKNANNTRPTIQFLPGVK